MRKPRAGLAALAAVLLAGAGAGTLGQEEGGGRPPEPATPAGDPPASTPEARPTPPEREEVSEDVFIPSEEIPADEAVVFPVDI